MGLHYRSRHQTIQPAECLVVSIAEAPGVVGRAAGGSDDVEHSRLAATFQTDDARYWR